MSERHYDVVVVGGGINGVGVAQAAAAAGHSVLLLEKHALAAGTSSKSSKLIHGGLRYLESWELALVREGLRERSLLLRIAPDLVTLRPFYIPVFRHTRRRPWLVRTGLSLYALLGRLESDVRFRKVPRGRWDALDGLVTENLQAVYRYWDAQTDDGLLTAAVWKSAEGLGAELALPGEFVAAELDNDGSAVVYRVGSDEFTCRARVLVNAAGPWVNQVLSRIDPSPPLQPVEWVQGTHIEVSGALERGIYYVEVPRDGRAVFAMPWKNHTLVGTTETKFRGNPDEVQPLRAEKSYLLRVLVRYFPRYAADAKVLSAFAGLRVLPAGPGHAFHRSRETILMTDRDGRHDQPRVLSIYGGKLTAWRATAAKVMARIESALPNRKPVADTRSLPLSPP
ncbi:MAG: FAD-dependent oxidoreductase [Gemmatimonadales bacterium]|jgi:glycerol-3-phosphate dehydrogenase